MLGVCATSVQLLHFQKMVVVAIWIQFYLFYFIILFYYTILLYYFILLFYYYYYYYYYLTLKSTSNPLRILFTSNTLPSASNPLPIHSNPLPILFQSSLIPLRIPFK